jgi:hypothetical protein
MTKAMPPIPPASQSRKGPGDDHRPDARDGKRSKEQRNLKEQGHQGNIHQNTHHQGHQQDR